MHVVILTLVLSSFSVRSYCTVFEDDYVLETLTSHPCQRACVEGEHMVCRYTFEVDWYYAMSKACFDCPNTITDCYRPDCIAVDGIPRAVMVVNRQLPGPSVDVCRGDTVIVDVKNKMADQTTTIHWHGYHQVDSPYSDGVPFVTQCPISPNSDFTYVMKATNPGTHFWHAHTGIQRADGVFGPLIVRIPESENEISNQYHVDSIEHHILINDWNHEASVESLQHHLHRGGDNYGYNILVNGRGRWYKNTEEKTKTPIAVFTVQKDLRYRFRLINAGIMNCPIEMYIDKHNFTAIASDGHNFQPVKVDALVSYAGERWDFIIDADLPIANYWIRFKGLMNCKSTKAHQVAILHYEGAPHVHPPEPIGYDVHPPPTMTLNALNVPADQPDTVSIPNLHSLYKSPPDDPLLREKQDERIYLIYDFNPVENPSVHRPGYGFYEVDGKMKMYTPQFNHLSFKMPSVPLLSQSSDIDPADFCYNQDVRHCQGKNNAEYCECINVIKIKTNSTVEVVLIDIGETYNANHAFHLHGYSFRVVAMDKLGDNVDPSTVENLDEAGWVQRNLIDPPFKDTVTVPDGGYTMFRFRADNPGYWLLHCHIEHHMEMKMAAVIQVGEQEEWETVPKWFPKCGNFNNTEAVKKAYKEVEESKCNKLTDEIFIL